MTDLISPDRVRFGPYEADLRTHELWKYGTRMKLVGQPFAILAVLVSRPGELVTREELQERLWPGETFVDFNHGLNAAVNKLRDVLSDSAEDPRYIETLPRRGYRFIAKVEREAAVETAAVPEPPSVTKPTIALAPVPQKITAPEVAPPKPLRESWVRKPLGGLIAFGCLVVGLVMLIHPRFRENTLPGEPAYMGDATIKGAMRVVATGGRNEGPQYSPDGKKIVFMANRGAGVNLWVCNTDGSEAHQITTLGDAGTPRWSPDGRLIAFDTHLSKASGIMVVGVDGDSPRLLMAGGSNNSVPSWSRDGRFIFFASDRTGRFEVWKMPSQGGEATQITHEGGFSGFESPDGKTFYYARTQFPNPEIWSVPSGGGTEAPLPFSVKPVTWAAWGISQNSIYFVEEGPQNVAELSAVDVTSRSLRQITSLGRFPFWLAVNADASKVAFDRQDSESASSVMQLEDFR
ncbi:MAG TPA: winged helix-turn-helix domain-containing protein [Candidatus Koribacter sp.]|jgi:DNA-binding winged helix-turn-helix (wHTH) protein